MTINDHNENWFGPELDEADDDLTTRLAGLAIDGPVSVLDRIAAIDGPVSVLDRIAATWVRVPSTAGELFVASTDQGVAYVRTTHAVHNSETEFAKLFRREFTRPLIAATRPPAGLLPALHEQRAAKLRFDLTQLSPFEREVLLAVLTIPRGQVRPYAWIANRIGRPKAVRAVGSALGRNPVPVLIPCHRVIRTNGTLGDYIFGPTTKRALLDAEGTNIGEIYELAQHNIHYVGSDTTGIVCFPSCPNARRITHPHRHGFRTLPQANTAGYRPCHHCQPTTEPA